MKYYIAADGGGTKLLAILYDEKFRIVNSHRMQGTNSIFHSKKQMAEKIYHFVNELIPADIIEIEGADLSVSRYEQVMLEGIQQRCRVRDYQSCNEGDVALAAAGVRYGIVAQAGTGSDAIMMQPDFQQTVGGWGFILGDEGSGYDIGLQTVKAAIYASDGRGKETIILDILMDEWGLSEPRDMIQKIMGEQDYKSLIASATGITAKAAKEKDLVALEIYDRAAHEMARQVLAVIKAHQGNWVGPIVASGGAWKGCRRMFEKFSEEVRSVYPQAEITYPIFEPVVGCAVMRQLLEGESFSLVRENMEEKFAQFLYNA